MEYRAAKTAQQQSLPPPPVAPAQVPQHGGPAAVAATAPGALPPQPPIPQPMVPAAPNPAGSAPQPDILAQLLNPQNPALQAALIQAVLQARGTAQGSVTLDDLADYLISQGRHAASRHYRRDPNRQ